MAKPITATSASSARNDVATVSSNVREPPAPSSRLSLAPKPCRGSQIATSAATSSAIPAKSTCRRAMIRGAGTSGASAISVAASTRDPTAAQASGAPWLEPPSTGATENASVPTPATKKPAASSRSSSATFDREADAGEDRDDRRGEHDGGVEHEPPFRQLVGVPQDRIGEEERRRRPQEGDEQQLTDEPRLERVLDIPLHVPLIGKRAVCR